MSALLSLLPVFSEDTVVRPLCLDDVQAFHRYRRDPELARLQGWSPMTDEEQARSFILEMAAVDGLRPGQWIQLGIADAATGTLLGDIGILLDQDAAAAEVGFTLASSAQGRGHGSRAVCAVASLVFQLSPVRLIRATTDARNLRSIHLLERAGFAIGWANEAVFKGEPCLELGYVLYRPADEGRGPGGFSNA